MSKVKMTKPKKKGVSPRPYILDKDGKTKFISADEAKKIRARERAAREKAKTKAKPAAKKPAAKKPAAKKPAAKKPAAKKPATKSKPKTQNRKPKGGLLSNLVSF